LPSSSLGSGSSAQIFLYDQKKPVKSTRRKARQGVDDLREPEFFSSGTDRVSKGFEQDHHVGRSDRLGRTPADHVVGIDSPSIVTLQRRAKESGKLIQDNGMGDSDPDTHLVQLAKAVYASS
jgi:hypothetical protein